MPQNNNTKSKHKIPRSAVPTAPFDKGAFCISLPSVVLGAAKGLSVQSLAQDSSALPRNDNTKGKLKIPPAGGIPIKHLIRPSGGCPQKSEFLASVPQPLSCLIQSKEWEVFVKDGFLGSHSKAYGRDNLWRKGCLVLRNVLR